MELMDLPKMIVARDGSDLYRSLGTHHASKSSSVTTPASHRIRQAQPSMATTSLELLSPQPGLNPVKPYISSSASSLSPRKPTRKAGNFNTKTQCMR